MQVREKVDGTAQNRIAVKQPLPQVNKDLAKQIMERKEATETLAASAAAAALADGKAAPVRARDKEQVDPSPSLYPTLNLNHTINPNL